MYKHFIKRLLDIILSIIAIPFLIPVVIIVGTMIYLEDRGPIFYNGERLGLNGKPFKMLKFRSMRVNAPDIRLEDGSTYNSDDDPRVTKIGRFIRKTSIDELPQLFNVLIGDMSWVGIRPDPLDWLDKYTDAERIILTVKPGITGYNQAYYRNSADGELKLKNDVYYAKNISFLLDAKCFLKTIKTVICRENINKQ